MNNAEVRLCIRRLHAAPQYAGTVIPKGVTQVCCDRVLLCTHAHAA